MHQERISIGRRTCSAKRPYHSGGAGDRLHHDWLSQRARHVLGYKTRGGIGSASRRKRHDERDVPVGIRLRRHTSPTCEKDGRHGQHDLPKTPDDLVHISVLQSGFEHFRHGPNVDECAQC
jgi:hypothetical protein